MSPIFRRLRRHLIQLELMSQVTEDKVSLKQLWFILVTSLKSLVVLRDIFYVISSIKACAYGFLI